MSRSTIRGNARRTRGGELRSLEGGRFIPWWDRRDIGEFRANIEYIRRYIIFGKIVGVWKIFRGFFSDLFLEKKEREREKCTFRGKDREVFWNIYRGIFGIESFWNRCFKVVSDFYQAVWFFWEMEEFWTEVYGNCIGTVCERLKLLSKGYSFWMVFIVLSFILKIFGIECSNRIEKFSKDILQFSFITLFYNFEKRYHTIFKLDI